MLNEELNSNKSNYADSATSTIEETPGSNKAEDFRIGEDNSFKGLCRNCENRETCLLPKSEAGVMHCEEYC